MKTLRTIKKLSLIFTATFVIVFGLALVAETTYAQIGSSRNENYVPLAPLPQTTISGTNETDFMTYISGIFKLGIGLAGVLAVFMIILGGVQYMTTDAVGNKTEGIERIQNALVGLLLALVSWIVLYTINPDLVSLKGINALPNKRVEAPIPPNTYNPGQASEQAEQTQATKGGVFFSIQSKQSNYVQFSCLNVDGYSSSVTSGVGRQCGEFSLTQDLQSCCRYTPNP